MITGLGVQVRVYTDTGPSEAVTEKKNLKTKEERRAITG